MSFVLVAYGSNNTLPLDYHWVKVGMRPNEDWIVVFDPRVIVSVRRVSPAEVKALGFDLPRIGAQLERLRGVERS